MAAIHPTAKDGGLSCFSYRNELFNLMVKEILEKIDETSKDYNNSADLRDGYVKEISDKIKIIHNLISED